MSKVDQYSRRIANYIYDDMDSVERMSFEEDLLNDTELAKEYKLQSLAINFLKSKSVHEELRSKPDLEEAERIVDEYMADQSDHSQSDSDQLDNKQVDFASSGGAQPDNKESDYGQHHQKKSDLSPSSPSRTFKIKRILYPLMTAAAVFAGLLIIRNVAIGNLNDRLFDTYYEPLDDVNFTGRGENNDMYSSFREAINFYHYEDYASSTSILSVLSSQNPDFSESHLYLALSEIGEEEYISAADELEIYLTRFKKYQPEAKWYLAMCYLKLDRALEAKDLISDLTGLGGAYGRDAQVILKKLDRIN